MAKYKRVLLKLSGESHMALMKKDWQNMLHKSKKFMNKAYRSAS